MKKFFILSAIFSIMLSIVMFNNSADGYFCCEEQHQTSSQCSSCSPHFETAFSTKIDSIELVFIPIFLGEIYFDYIHIDSAKYNDPLDRPPAKLS